MDILTQANGNGQRLTMRELDGLWRDYCQAWDVADNADARDMPQKGELWQYAVDKEQLYMAAQYTNGYSWGSEKVTR